MGDRSTEIAAQVAARVAEYIEEKQPVELVYNDDTGEWVWAISVLADPGFWLDAFDSELEARRFCLLHGLPIVEGK